MGLTESKNQINANSNNDYSESPKIDESSNDIKHDVLIDFLINDIAKRNDINMELCKRTLYGKLKKITISFENLKLYASSASEGGFWGFIWIKDIRLSKWEWVNINKILTKWVEHILGQGIYLVYSYNDAHIIIHWAPNDKIASNSIADIADNVISSNDNSQNEDLTHSSDLNDEQPVVESEVLPSLTNENVVVSPPADEQSSSSDSVNP